MGDAHMYFRKPVVLLLGGMLTAAAIGCSAASVLVKDQRPKQSVRQSSSDRMLAIGRMFEEQGKLERAEAMYRGALKRNGRNQEAQQLLSDLQTRRRSPQPAMVADVPRPARTMGVSAQTPAPASTVRQVAVKPPVTAAVTAPAKPASPAAQPVKTVSRLKTVATTSPGTSATPAAPAVSATPAGPTTPAAPMPGTLPPENKSAEKAAAGFVLPSAPAATPTPAPAAVAAAAPASSGKTITLDEVLAAAEAPAEHGALLAQALKSGDVPEARCLAAALLGECRSGDAQIAAALQESGRTTDDVSLLLAVVDSQQQHNLMDSATVENLIRLLPECEPAVQVQGVTMMRHCSALSCREECVGLLTSLLESSHADVRAAAALTFSDFRPLSVDTVSRLEKLSADDSSEEVRESAAASLARGVK